MPATRAVASTLPFAIVWVSIRLSVSFCKRISPRATAWRRCTRYDETSTIRASPFAPICVNRFMFSHEEVQKSPARKFAFSAFFCGSNLNGFLPLLNRRAHLIGGVQARFYKLRCKPRKRPQQVRRHQNLPVAVRPGTDANGRDRNFARDFPGDRRGDEFQH